MCGCARESLLCGLAGDAQLGADRRPRCSGLTGPGDGGGEVAFGSLGLFVCGAYPVQDIKAPFDGERSRWLAFAEGGAACLA